MATLESNRLSGGFAGTAQVESLQQALKSLAQVANWPAADPGTIDGIVGIKTVSAVLAVINNVKEIPSDIKIALSITLAIALTDTTARGKAFDLVSAHAAGLTLAITAAIARYAGTSLPTTAPGLPRAVGGKNVTSTTGTLTKGSGSGSFWSPAAGTPWYRQGRVYAIGGGIAALGVGAFYVFRR